MLRSSSINYPSSQALACRFLHVEQAMEIGFSLEETWRFAGKGFSLPWAMPLLFALALPVALFGQAQGGGTIAGKVRDSHNLPVRAVVKLLIPGEMPAGEVYTDSEGGFYFQNLSDGEYYIVVEAEGYVPFRQKAFISSRLAGMVQVNPILEPLSKSGEKPGQIISGSPKTYKLNAKEGNRQFAPKVLQEFERANQKQKDGDIQGAISHYKKALKIEPTFYPALNNLGALYLRAKDFEEATSSFEKSIKFNPEDGEAYINLGHVSYEQGEYQAAIRYLEQGLKRSPQSAVGQFFMGSSNLKTGNLIQAESQLKKAYKLDPENMSPALLQLANIYLKMQETGAAGNMLKLYLQANPNDPQAPAIKKTIAKLSVH